MRDFYQIHELAKLFGLHPDTLRYYEEKGLLHPERRENGYRVYRIRDICTLNIVRAQRELGVPVEEIGAYLERRSVSETLAFLDRQEELLERKMAELVEMRGESRERRARLLRYYDAETGVVTCQTMPERPCVILQEDVILEKEIDFLLKKLEKRHSNTIKIMGRQTMGALLDQSAMRPGDYKHFASVFFLTGPGQERDTALPAGEYARLFYRGSYERLEEHCQTLFRGVEELCLAVDGAPLELYRIDAHDTDLEEEYLTELQVKVKRP